MKIQILLLLMTFVVAAVPVSVLAMSGGEFEVTWSGIGIAGESSGGEYSQAGLIQQIEPEQMTGGEFAAATETVILSDCFVNIELLAEFAQHWLEPYCDIGNDWCGGADIDESTVVDLTDFGLFTQMWLSFCLDN